MQDGSSIDRVARDVLDSLLEGCQVIDGDFRYLYVNEVAARQGQRPPSELLGRTMMACYPGIEATPMFATLRRCLAERTGARLENVFTFPDGSTGVFELRFLPVSAGVCVLSLDVSEARRAEAALKRTEEQLRHAQKMEAVGRLAGGVAHDFNNILSVVLSYSSLALRSMPEDDPRRGDLEEIAAAGNRAAALTRQLLLFCRQQVHAPRVLDVNEILSGLEGMCRRLLGADVDLKVVPAPSLGRVRIDPSNLEQVIMNLAVNARDAMPTGGKLTIETADVTLDAEYARQHLGSIPGRHVMVAVTDTGVGMDRGTLERIFDPFFTTKPVGKGTGLGLSNVFGIVQQVGGSIWVYSEPGRGATFKVYFPVADAEPHPTAAPAVAAQTAGTETVLLVEDDPHVRAVVQGVLVRSGYRVIAAANAEAALARAADHMGSVDLLLTDIVLPGLDGPALALKLRATRAAVKVLFMSGYTDDTVYRHGVLEAGTAFVQKPLTPEKLTLAVRQTLDGALQPGWAALKG